MSSRFLSEMALGKSENRLPDLGFFHGQPDLGSRVPGLERYVWIVCVLMIMMLSACGQSNEGELRRYINGIKSRPSKPIEPIPEFTPPAKFTYPEEDTRRSPFKPLMDEIREEESFAPDMTRPKQPLEGFSLDALRFVGTLKEGSTLWGLISQPGGLVTRVRSGDYLGKQYGQILRITEQRIEIEETVKIGGKWEKKKNTLQLLTN